MLSDHFTNVITQKAVKTKFVNNCRAYIRMKNKMVKMQHNSAYKHWLRSELVTVYEKWSKTHWKRQN